MGIVVGGLLAMGATVAQREIMRRAGTRLIDWEAVRAIARRRLGRDDTLLVEGDMAYVFVHATELTKLPVPERFRTALGP